MSVSKTILIGNVGQDPEVRYFQDGTAVCNISLATSERWKDKQTGERKEHTEWHRVSIRGKLAEIAGQYLRKGSKVYIEGQNKTREWEKDGIKRYTTEVVVGLNGQMQMLDSRDDSGSQNANHTPQDQAARQQPRHTQQADEYSNFDDDIPF